MIASISSSIARPVSVSASTTKPARRTVVVPAAQTSRRDALLATTAAVGALFVPQPALADSDTPVICDAECVSTSIEGKTPVELPSGLKYIDIVEGKGAKPVVGYQVVAHYVAMLPDGRVFFNSKEAGPPKDFRVGSGAIVQGLDEGVLTMKVGGTRRIFVPGAMGFPKGLGAAPGRPRVKPYADIMFDVTLYSVPGLDEEEEE